MTNQVDPKKTEKLAEAIEDLDNDIAELDTTLERTLKSHGIWPTFFRGIIGALGAAIGATLVIALIVFILQKLAGVPFVGDYISTLLNEIQQNK